MSVQHHPSDETMARFAAGTLSAGAQLVVASHIEGCSHCRAGIATYEAVGGALLEGSDETALRPDCLANVWSMIERDETASVLRKRAILTSPHRPDGIVLPRALDRCDVGPWRWLGHGIRLSRVKVPGEPDANLILLRVSPNHPLPEHGHTGTEFTQVLTGSLIDGTLKLMPGDIMEADQDLQHQPYAGPECDCISLAAVDGKLKINTFIGQVVLNVLGL